MKRLRQPTFAVEDHKRHAATLFMARDELQKVREAIYDTSRITLATRANATLKSLDRLLEAMGAELQKDVPADQRRAENLTTLYNPLFQSLNFPGNRSDFDFRLPWSAANTGIFDSDGDWVMDAWSPALAAAIVDQMNQKVLPAS